MPLDALVAFFETLDEARLGRLSEFYTADAWFQDPFNAVRGAADIEGIFRHMFVQVDAPRFVVTERIVDARGAVLVWDFHFIAGGTARRIHGASHLRFDADGRVNYHRDYLDAAGGLYARLPLVGPLMRWLRRRLAAPGAPR